MKKVLHLTYDMRIGGTEQVIKNLIEGSDKSLYEMSIFCLEQPTGPFGEILIKQGIKVTGTQRKDGFDVSIIKRLRSYIKNNHIDIVHCHQYTPWVYGTLAALFTKTKVIFTEHGRFYPDRSSWKRAIINPLLVKFTDKITTIAKATQQALVEYEYIPLNRIEVIYNGISPLISNEPERKKLIDHWDIKPDTKIIGTIARLDPIKNQAMMLQAFKTVLQSCPNTILFIIGDGEEMDNLLTLSDQYGIREHVIFTGYITNPVNYLHLMDIFLLSSLSEGTSMTLLEAMSLGKPCVVTDAGGNPEIISHETNGSVTPNQDAAAFADAVIDLLSNKEKYQRLAAASLDVFNKRFELKFMVNEYLRIYQSL